MSSQLQSLSTRLQALSDSLRTTLQLIDRLAKLNFQPGSQPLDDNGDAGSDVRVELGSEIHEGLKQEEEQLELLRQEVEDLIGLQGPSNRRRDSDSDRDRSRLSIQIARLGEDIKHARAQFRRAQLQAKRSAETARQKERALLFSTLQQQQQQQQQPNGRATPPSGTRRRGAAGSQASKPTDDEIVLNASSDVTAALRRTQQLLTAELTRSRFAHDTLQRSNAAVAGLSDSYAGLDELLARSKGLLSTLVSSTKSDTWYLETAFYLLAATVVWLVFRRLLYAPLWWLVWFPVRTGYRVLASVLGVAGVVGSAAGKESASSLQINSSLSASRSLESSISVSSVSTVMAGSENEQKRGGDPSPDGSVSQEVGRMAEESRQKRDKEPVVRGDGTVLPERAEDQPRNPKKRVFDAGAEPAKPESQRDEL